MNSSSRMQRKWKIWDQNAIFGRLGAKLQCSLGEPLLLFSMSRNGHVIECTLEASLNIIWLGDTIVGYPLTHKKERPNFGIHKSEGMYIINLMV